MLFSNNQNIITVLSQIFVVRDSIVYFVKKIFITFFKCYSSHEEEEDEEHYLEEDDEDDFVRAREVSDHEFSPESDLEGGEPVRSARTAVKSMSFLLPYEM